MTSILATAASWVISFGFGAAALFVMLWPFAAVYFLGRRLAKGTPLPSAGIYGIYLGGLPWTFAVFYESALRGLPKLFIPVPLMIAAALAVAWNRLMEPPRGYAASGGDAAVLLGLAMMSFVTCGGGMYDKMITIPAAQQRLTDAHVDAADPAALSRALDDPDPMLRWGAVLALRRLSVESAPVRDALTKALAGGDERVSFEAARSFSYQKTDPAPSVLGPLLDSPDAAARARAEKSLMALDPAKRAAAQEAVARWRAQASTSAAASPPRP